MTGPNPKWVWAERGPFATWKRAGWLYGVTTVGEMHGRTDLDQWEYAHPFNMRWIGCSDLPGDGSAGFPVIVRRKIEDGAT